MIPKGMKCIAFRFSLRNRSDISLNAEVTYKKLISLFFKLKLYKSIYGFDM
jgi:hypothetical protein